MDQQPLPCSLLTALMLALVSPACTLTSVDQETPERVFLAGSGSFDSAMGGVDRVSLHPGARIVKPKVRESGAILQQEMDRAVEAVLRERGFVVVPPGQGDRLIAYAIGIEGEMTDREMVELFGISPGLEDYKESRRGGMVLSVIHAQTNQVLWRGSGSGSGEGPAVGTYELESDLREAIRAILTGRMSPTE